MLGVAYCNIGRPLDHFRGVRADNHVEEDGVAARRQGGECLLEEDEIKIVLIIVLDKNWQQRYSNGH